MIYVSTKFKVADNSGAIYVRCIGINGSTGTKVARVGDFILISIRTCSPNGKVKKGQICGAIVVRSKKNLNRSDGMSVRFDDNAVVLVDRKTREPMGTRVLGPVAREVRAASSRIVSLSSDVL